MKRGILYLLMFILNALMVNAQEATWQSEHYTNAVPKKTTLQASSPIAQSTFKNAGTYEEQTGENAYNYVDVNYLLWVQNAAVGIGQKLSESSDYMLGVGGTIGAFRIEVKASAWADDVFEENYKIPTLYELEKFIKANKHLPDVPSEKEVKEQNIDLGAMDATLLRKIEELTLYIIEQEKRIAALEAQLTQ